MTIEEEFNADKTGADCTTCHLNTDFCMECIAMRKAAFLAGAAAQRMKDVEVALRMVNTDAYKGIALTVNLCCRRIAEAIEKG